MEGSTEIFQNNKNVTNTWVNQTVTHPPFLPESCCAGETTWAESSGGSRSSSQAAERVVRILRLERASPRSAPLDPKPASSSVPAAAAATSLSPSHWRCAQQRLAALWRRYLPAWRLYRFSLAALPLERTKLRLSFGSGHGCFCLICIDDSLTIH